MERKILKESSYDDFIDNHLSELQKCKRILKQVALKIRSSEDDTILNKLEKSLRSYDKEIQNFIVNADGTETTRDIATAALNNMNRTGTEMGMILQAIEEAGAVFGIYIISESKKLKEAVKQPKIFTIKCERPGSGGRFGSDTRVSYYTGTMEYMLNNVFGYTLEVGQSWQHEKGNKKINRNPKTPEQLAINLYNAKNNAAADGYSGYNYEVVPNEENPKYQAANTAQTIEQKPAITENKKLIKTKIAKKSEKIKKIKALSALLEKYTKKKVTFKEYETRSERKAKGDEHTIKEDVKMDSDEVLNNVDTVKKLAEKKVDVDVTDMKESKLKEARIKKIKALVKLIEAKSGKKVTFVKEDKQAQNKQIPSKKQIAKK